MMREGIVGMLHREADMIVAGTAESGRDAVDLFRALGPTLVLMDVQMPGMTGVEATAQIRAHDPTALIIILTTYPGDAQARAALAAGASGYLLKTCIRKELLEAIRATLRGQRVISPEVARDIALNAFIDPLTDREKAVLRAVAKGRGNKEIAWGLGIAVDTVKADLKSVFAKLDVSDRTEAVVVALRRGDLLLPPS